MMIGGIIGRVRVTKHRHVAGSVSISDLLYPPIMVSNYDDNYDFPIRY